MYVDISETLHDVLTPKLALLYSILENKARFVEEVCRDELVVSDRKRTELLAELKEAGYDMFPKDPTDTEENGEDDGEEMDDDDTTDAELAKGYEYLLGMKIWSLTFERAEELRHLKGVKSKEVKALQGTSPETIWNKDLDAIEELLDERDKELGLDAMKQKSKKKQTKKGRKKRVDEVSCIDLNLLDTVSFQIVQSNPLLLP